MLKPIDSLIGSLRTLLAQPTAGGPAPATVRTTFDISDLAFAPKNEAFGCGCQKNPSGLSDAEKAAAKAENLKAMGLA